MTALIRHAALAAALTLALAAASGAVFAGGEDYDEAGEAEKVGPAYFGFVWDQRGWPLADARVVLRPKTGKPVELKSNVLGLYRSHISKDVRPDDVELVCEKPGYKPMRIIRRATAGSAATNIEIDCMLQRM
jgi:hypothetical protein